MKTVTIGEKEYQLEFTFEAAEHRGLIQSMFRILSGSYLVRRGTVEAQENEPEREGTAASMLDGVAEMISDMPHICRTAFYAGLLEHHRVPEDTAAQLMVDACWDTIAAIDTMEIFHEKELEGCDFCCIHFDADGDHFVYDSREYIGLNEEEFIEKFPSPIVEYAFREDRYLPDASEQELLEQNIDEKIKNPIIKYADKKLREN